MHYQSLHSVKIGYTERRTVGRFGARTVKLMNGYRALPVFLIRDGTTSELPSRVFVIFLIVLHDRAAASRPPRQYEFATGYNTYFGPDRYQVGEQFFFHSPALVVRVSMPNRSQGCSFFTGAKSKSSKEHPYIAFRVSACLRSGPAPSPHGKRGSYWRGQPVPWFC